MKFVFLFIIQSLYFVESFFNQKYSYSVANNILKASSDFSPEKNMLPRTCISCKYFINYKLYFIVDTPLYGKCYKFGKLDLVHVVNLITCAERMENIGNPSLIINEKTPFYNLRLNTPSIPVTFTFYT